MFVMFACMSLIAFTVSVNAHDTQEDVQVQRETDTGS